MQKWYHKWSQLRPRGSRAQRNDLDRAWWVIRFTPMWKKKEKCNKKTCFITFYSTRFIAFLWTFPRTFFCLFQWYRVHRSEILYPPVTVLEYPVPNDWTEVKAAPRVRNSRHKWFKTVSRSVYPKFQGKNLILKLRSYPDWRLRVQKIPFGAKFEIQNLIRKKNYSYLN